MNKGGTTEINICVRFQLLGHSQKKPNAHAKQSHDSIDYLRLFWLGQERQKIGHLALLDHDLC